MTEPSATHKINSPKIETGYQTINDKYAKGFGKSKSIGSETIPVKNTPIGSIEPLTPSDKSNNKNSKIRWLCLILIPLIFFAVAIIKNPSELETKALIKGILVERINEKMNVELRNEDNTGFEKFGILLGQFALPQLLDSYVNITVSNYLLFSTFKCTAQDGNKIRNVVSGMVIVGKVIPLSSDLNKETMEFN